MRKSYLLHSLAMACLLPVAAQAQQIQVGVIGGANFGDLRATDELGTRVDTDRQNTFTVGGVTDFPVSKLFSIRLTPMYVRSTATLLIGDENSVDMDSRMSFIELPVLLTVRWNGRVQPFLSAGPSIGYMLTSALDAFASGIEFTGDAMPITHRLDLGVVAAVGAAVSVGPGTVFCEGRYAFGLTDIHKAGTVVFQAGSVSEAVAYPDTAELSTRAFRLLVGATVPL